MSIEHFEILGNYAVFRPTGEVTLERAVEMITDAITIDPHKFGITVAATLGSIAEVFTSEKDALKWLESL